MKKNSLPFIYFSLSQKDAKNIKKIADKKSVLCFFSILTNSERFFVWRQVQKYLRISELYIYNYQYHVCPSKLEVIFSEFIFKEKYIYHKIKKPFLKTVICQKL